MTSQYNINIIRIYGAFSAFRVLGNNFGTPSHGLQHPTPGMVEEKIAVFAATRTADST
jgi:hypothetical protein